MKHHLKIFLLVLLLPAGFYCFGQREADSLKNELAKPHPDTVKVSLLNQLSEMLPEGEWEIYNEKMEAFAAKKLRTAKGRERIIYLGSLASAYNNKSIVYKNTGQTALALKYGKKSLALFTQLGDKHNISIISFNNGKLYHLLGDIGNAIQSIQYALKLSKKYTRDIESYCINYLGFISSEQQEYEKALEYHEAAYALAKNTGDREALAYSISCKSIVLQNQKKYNESLQASKQALEIYSSLQSEQNIASQYLNIGAAYEKLKEHALAHENFMQALQRMEQINYAAGISAVTSSIGQNYLEWGKEQEAEKYFTRSLTIGRQIGFPRHIHPPAEGLYKLYKKRGDLKKALEMYELSVQMRDSVNNEAVKKKLLNSQYRYEYEKKAATDSIRAIEREKLRGITIEKERSLARTRQYALIAGIGVLLVIGFFVFQRFRLRQKLKELRIRNKIASDLHDEVGSALSSISLLSGMAGMQQDNNRQTIRKIEETSRETMENMSDIVWSIQPRNDKLTAVVNRMRNHGQQLFSSLGIDFEFTIQGEITDLPLNMEQRKGLYLVYKEALNNAAKYAAAQKITVTISSQLRHITMVITDNGKGFDTSEKRDGNGLYTMQERAARLNGQLTLHSSPGNGTRVQLVFKTA